MWRCVKTCFRVSVVHLWLWNIVRPKLRPNPKECILHCPGLYLHARFWNMSLCFGMMFGWANWKNELLKSSGLPPPVSQSSNLRVSIKYLVVIPEILLDPAGLFESLHQLRRDQLVPLEDRGPGAVWPVPHLGRVGLPPERLFHRHHQQGHLNPEHLQAVLLEVGLRTNVLERIRWLVSTREVREIKTTLTL